MIFWFLISASALATLAFILTPLFFTRTQNQYDLSDEAILRLKELDEDLQFGDVTLIAHEKLKKTVALEILQRQTSFDEMPAYTGKYKISAAVLLAVLVAIPIYLKTGSPDIGQFMSNNPGTTISSAPATAAILLNRLKAKASSEPLNKHAWESLARSYLMLGLTDDAITASKKLVELDGGSSQARLLFIEASIAQDNGVFKLTTIAMLDEIISAEPMNPLALTMRGLAYHQEGQADKALAYLLRASQNLPIESPLSQNLLPMIESLENNTPTSPQKIPLAYPLVQISLSPELLEENHNDATVYITVHSAADSKVPIAAMKRPALTLPLEFSLADINEMRSGAPITAKDAVMIKARVTNSGSIKTKPGDWIGYSAPFLIAKKRQIRIIIAEISE
ncbi:MAG: c-type cytochrome biogenesis protein CcmI [Proteobacteria bacterium]|mgnify:FL=1|nr:c-type cytochrome biogenesis protein CcmI [Pseudomonadota bacterium]MBT5065637.1 c-type cytochrome biogenesis protein CcmI [Pseudomonadota bacterium]MBT6192971.1 c-type cytochrome biogenesis protein CcmI [Pseudomonadota bacterium]MBT7245633.1 c-type cytochrome biogenesis protein CcmI [Pseudomonadota bacterium]MBT7562435.1 c-type cytochrome biogenesis protein CcmI [Pseudomonadota bacterium]